MATTYQGTTNGDLLFVQDPAGRHGETATWNGLEGTDTLFMDPRAKATFKYTQDQTDPTIIHMDGVSGASAWHYKLISIEKVEYGSKVTDLTALFPNAFGPDVDPPTVDTFIPADNATGVALDANIVLTFSENIVKGTGNIVLKNGSGTTIATYDAATSTNLTVSGKVLTINPTDNLTLGTAYTVELAAGTIKDAAGNSYAGTTTYNFTATDITTTNGTAAADTMTGNSGRDALNGLAGDDTLTGNGGNDILDGGKGKDSMFGGAGNDTYVVDDKADKVYETATDTDTTDQGGTDTVQSSITFTLGDFFENLTLTGKSAINGTGNGLNNRLTGNDGANILDGGTGADSMYGGAGKDTYIVDSSSDYVEEAYTSKPEIDTVKASVSHSLGYYVENLILTGTNNINGTGNYDKNTIVGNDGNNRLDGGSDYVILTGINKNIHVDKLVGGKGDDTYVVDLIFTTTKATLEDTIIEAAKSGTDTLELGINNGSYSGIAPAKVTLANNLENLNAGSTGSNLLDLTGNGADNVITGNNAANTINGAGGNDSIAGGGGNDKLIGGKGLDTLTGGAGSDIFVFDTALNATTNLDTITDFTAGTDDIQLSKGIFAKLKNDTDLSDNIALGTAAVDDKDFLIYDSTTGALSYDADGNGAKTAVQFAVIGVSMHPALTAGDFLIV